MRGSENYRLSVALEGARKITGLTPDSEVVDTGGYNLCMLMPKPKRGLQKGDSSLDGAVATFETYN
jgi:hypothetical protein